MSDKVIFVPFSGESEFLKEKLPHGPSPLPMTCGSPICKNDHGTASVSTFRGNSILILDRPGEQLIFDLGFVIKILVKHQVQNLIVDHLPDLFKDEPLPSLDDIVTNSRKRGGEIH